MGLHLNVNVRLDWELTSPGARGCKHNFISYIQVHVQGRIKCSHCKQIFSQMISLKTKNAPIFSQLNLQTVNSQ